MTAVEELVVLVDDAGVEIGTAPKRTVHHAATPLHLAFSCYVFDAAGRVLVTQRAMEKVTWPGEWTNSFCGHPAPGEHLHDAIQRRAEDELGIALAALAVALPDFRYEATMSNNVRENELCPVFTAVSADDVRPDPAEVMAFEWVPWPLFRDQVRAGERPISPWCRMQVDLLSEAWLPPGLS